MPSSLVTRMHAGLPSRLISGSSAIGPDQIDARHIRPESRRNAHAAVRLLIVFENGDERAPDRQARAVERMDMPRCPALARRTIAGIHAPCLEIAAHRA